MAQNVSAALQNIIDLFDERLPLAHADWLTLAREIQAQSFTMAGIWNDSFLEQLQDSITQAMTDGLSFDQWYPVGQRLVAKFGGLVNVAVKDELGLMDPAYARLVFNNATSSAYAAGRYARMFTTDRVASHPYVVYETMQDDRVRDAHAELQGRVFDKNDGMARPLFPPSDHNCRCWLTELSAEEKKAGHYRLSRGESFPRPPGDWNVDRVQALVPEVFRRTFGMAASALTILEVTEELELAQFYNKYHEPAGTPQHKGGEFAHAPGGQSLSQKRASAGRKALKQSGAAIRKSKANEAWLADALAMPGAIIIHTPDNKPVDVIVIYRGKAVGVELKSNFSGKHGRVNMGTPCRKRKEKFSRLNGNMPLVTVSFDDRNLHENPAVRARWSTYRFHYQGGVKAYRYGEMLASKNPTALKRFIYHAAKTWRGSPDTIRWK